MKTATLELNETQWNMIVIALKNLSKDLELKTPKRLADEIEELVQVQY